MTTTTPDNDAVPQEHRAPLTFRELIDFFLRDQVIRPTLFAALGSLAMIFVFVFLNGSTIGAILVAFFGLATIFLRWTAGPPLMLLTLLYFFVFPFDVPDTDLLYANPYEVPETFFRVSDAILVLVIMIFIISAYRLLGVIHQSLPRESLRLRKGDYPGRRPTHHIHPNEFAWMLATAAIVVVSAQVAWWVINSLEFVPASGKFPIRWSDAEPGMRYRNRPRDAGEFTAGGHRFYIMLLGFFVGFLLLRGVFGYWRYRALKPTEASMILTDASWCETHRERVRIESWRKWWKKKSIQRARKQHERAKQMR